MSLRVQRPENLPLRLHAKRATGRACRTGGPPVATPVPERVRGFFYLSGVGSGYPVSMITSQRFPSRRHIVTYRPRESSLPMLSVFLLTAQNLPVVEPIVPPLKT